MKTPNLTSSPPWIGECLDDDHPERVGLYLVAFPGEDGDPLREIWLESLVGVPVKRFDRVLLTQPLHWPQPIIIGSLGPGFSSESPKPAFEVRENNVVVLQGNSPIQVVSHDGRKLVEIGKGMHGPTIRICQKDAAIHLPGKLAISAAELTLHAFSGDVQIEADHDVVVQGDLIRLN